MRETPAQFLARTGAPPPACDLSALAPAIGSTPRPPSDEEACPTLFRDVGPQALARFLSGRLERLEGRGSCCVWMRDASLPGYSACAAQFGVLVLLQPLSLGPWLSGQAGIWVAQNGRMPASGSMAFLPAGYELGPTAARLEDVGTAEGLREALGGADHEARAKRAEAALDAYLDDWAKVERLAAPLRERLDGTDPEARDSVQRALDDRGLTSKDLRAPWFHLSPERRDLVRPRLEEIGAVLRIGP